MACQKSKETFATPAGQLHAPVQAAVNTHHLSTSAAAIAAVA